MRMEVHIHASIPLLEGVSKSQIESALEPWLDYIDLTAIDEVKSLEPNEPGIQFDESNRMLDVCWTGEIGRTFEPVLERSLALLGPYCEEAVEVDFTIYLDNGEDESRLLFVGPNAQAIHEAQRRCMLEDVAAVLGRQFDKRRVDEALALVNDLFDRDWVEKKSDKKQERGFDSYTVAPNRKNLH